MIANDRLQLTILAGVSVAFVALTAVAYRIDPLAFRRWLGPINPPLASIVIALLGAGLLAQFLSRGWFAIYTAAPLQRLLLVFLVAAVLAALMILVDARSPFARDINVSWPASLFFYPVIAYAVEILFHVLPLAILLITVTALFGNLSFADVVWPCFLVVALLEPLFQTRLALGNQPAWVMAILAAHLLVFNLIQLALFKRYDFITMFAFRLLYYGLWHILWGHARLGLLF